MTYTRYKTRDNFLKSVPEILYTGTTLRYLINRLQSSQDFSHSLQRPVYLTKDYISAAGFAYKRARQYQDSPMVVIVDSQHLSKRPKKTCTGYEIPSLKRGSFYPLPAVYPKSMQDKNAWYQIHSLTQVVKILQPNELSDLVDNWLETISPLTKKNHYRSYSRILRLRDE